MVDSDPCFILQRYYCWTDRYQLYFTDFSDHSQGKVVLDRSDNFFMLKFSVDSCNGLLCMLDSRGIYIYNPFTRLSMEIPNLQFGFDPTTKEYKLIHIVRQKQSRTGNGPNRSTSVQSEVHILTIGDSGWRNLGMISYRFRCQRPKAMVNGRLHWL
ncbi:hypothetical protein DITRI_Ditri13aG0137500 [Diplodiscus trichospermus]